MLERTHKKSAAPVGRGPRRRLGCSEANRRAPPPGRSSGPSS